jgi:hypothetical protein
MVRGGGRKLGCLSGAEALAEGGGNAAVCEDVLETGFVEGEVGAAGG